MTPPPPDAPRVILVHHADAVGPDVDAQRPLSPRGRTQAAWLAARAHEAGLRPLAIWHSGKLRARQTAEAFLGTCNPGADFRMVRGLRPDDPAEWMRDAIDAEDRDVLLVSHMPLLPALYRLLVPDAGPFPPHGLVVLARTGERTYEERLRLDQRE